MERHSEYWDATAGRRQSKLFVSGLVTNYIPVDFGQVIMQASERVVNWLLVGLSESIKFRKWVQEEEYSYCSLSKPNVDWAQIKDLRLCIGRTDRYFTGFNYDESGSSTVVRALWRVLTRSGMHNDRSCLPLINTDVNSQAPTATRIWCCYGFTVSRRGKKDLSVIRIFCQNYSNTNIKLGVVLGHIYYRINCMVQSLEQWFTVTALNVLTDSNESYPFPWF